MNVQRLRRGCVFLAVFFLGGVVGAVASDYIQARVRADLPFYLIGWAAESYDNGEPLEAISLLMKATQWDREWYAPYLQLGQIYQKEGCDKLALQCFREAKRLMESAEKHEDAGIQGDRQIIDRSLQTLVDGEENSSSRAAR
jgi:Tfp pilus assembly protein PilF